MAGEAVDDGGRRKQLQKMQKAPMSGKARDGLGATLSMYDGDNTGGASYKGLQLTVRLVFILAGPFAYKCKDSLWF